MPPAKLEAERGVNESMSAGNELTARASGRVPTVTVVLPCLDEASSIVACIEEARYGLERSELTGEVLVVDNGSTDGSVEIARQCGARVLLAPNRGYGSAAQPGEGSSMSARCEPPPWAASGPSAERDGPLRGSATVCSESRP